MKCLSCGSEIPNNSQSCPFCGENVTKNENLMETATLPVTPSEIQLPTDQAKMANTGAINIITDDNIDIPNMVKNDPELPETKNELELPEVKDDSLENSESVVITGGNIDINSGEISTPESEMETITFNPDNVDPNHIDPLMKKQFPLKIVIIVVILAILGVGGYFGYYYVTQYMSGNKRVEAVIDSIFNDYTKEAKNENVEKGSGKFEASINIGQNSNIYKMSFDGSYGYNLKEKLMSYILNINDLRFNEQVVFDKNNQLNLKMFLENGTIYYDLVNFYDKYITLSSDELNQIINSIEQNDIDYVNMINVIKKGIKEAAGELTVSQSVDTVKFNDVSKKANVVTIKFTAKNQKKFYEKFMDTLLKDSLFMKDMSLLTGKTEDELKADYNNSKNNTYTDSDTKIEICTALYAEELIGIRVIGTTTELDITPISNGYSISLIDDTKKVFDLSYSYTKEESVKTIDEHLTMNLIINNDADVYNVDIDFKNTSDINPVVERKEEKEAIPFEYIDGETLNSIMNNIYNYGNFGALIQSLYTSNLVETDIMDIETSSYCAQAFSCSEPVDGYSICNYMNEYEEIDTVTCPIN